MFVISQIPVLILFLNSIESKFKTLRFVKNIFVVILKIVILKNICYVCCCYTLVNKVNKLVGCTKLRDTQHSTLSYTRDKLQFCTNFYFIHIMFFLYERVPNKFLTRYQVFYLFSFFVKYIIKNSRNVIYIKMWKYSNVLVI